MTLKHAINSTIIMNTIIIDYFVLFNKIILLTRRNKYHNVDFFFPHIQQNLNLNIQLTQDYINEYVIFYSLQKS